MKKVRGKELLEAQISSAIEIGVARKVATSSYYEWLEIFLGRTDQISIIDVPKEEWDAFLEYIRATYPAQWEHKEAERAVRFIKTFYDARVKNTQRRFVKGRPPLIGEIRKVQNYRKKGLTLSEIASLVHRKIPQVHKWVHYPIKEEME